MSFLKQFFSIRRSKQAGAPPVPQPVTAVGGTGQGPARQPGGSGAGPGGECVCPSCNAKASHQIGAPCYEQKCPRCGQPMMRTK
jgi:hypothetical protein